jgi:N-acetylglucosamine-6-sulfatase
MQRLLTVLLVLQLSSPAFALKPRNIVVFLIDDLRFDTVGYAGHPFLKTPHIDRLAKNGANFKNAFVTTSLCSPSRASILTGLYAHNHRVVDNYNPVNDQLVFFPQLLQKAGYENAFIGKWHMGDTEEPQRGFDHWVSFKGQGIYWPHDTDLEVKGRYVPQATKSGININGVNVAQKGYITDELTDYAVDWLDDRDGQKPWLLYVSHKAVHADFLPPNRHAYKYKDQEVTLPDSWASNPEAFKDVPMWVRNQRNSRHGTEFAYYTDLNLADYYRRYCETILAVDDSVGRVTAWLEQKGQLTSTLILFLGDNGFLFGEHGLIDKRCAYEESIRIPMLMHCPELIKSDTIVSEVVANIDVAPTLLQTAGVAIPTQMQGRSMLPLVKGEAADWRDYLLYEYYWERNYPQTPTMHALRGNQFKYIRYHGIWDTDELYDIKADPRERTNLINDPAHAGRIAEMNKRLFEVLDETDGMELPMVGDKGTKFHHRRIGGTPGAEFHKWMYRPAGTTGK